MAEAPVAAPVAPTALKLLDTQVRASSLHGNPSLCTHHLAVRPVDAIVASVWKQAGVKARGLRIRRNCVYGTCRYVFGRLSTDCINEHLDQMNLLI